VPVDTSHLLRELRSLGTMAAIKAAAVETRLDRVALQRASRRPSPPGAPPPPLPPRWHEAQGPPGLLGTALRRQPEAEAPFTPEVTALPGSLLGRMLGRARRQSHDPENTGGGAGERGGEHEHTDGGGGKHTGGSPSAHGAGECGSSDDLVQSGIRTAAVHFSAEHAPVHAVSSDERGGGVNGGGVSNTKGGSPAAATGGAYPPDGPGGAGKWAAPHWQHALAEVGLHELWYQPGLPKSFDLQVGSSETGP
jgi:hypothetical protein